MHQVGFKWILDIIWPLNQHFKLKNQKNWIKQVLVLKFLSGINCILLHWKKETYFSIQSFFLDSGRPSQVHLQTDNVDYFKKPSWKLLMWPTYIFLSL